MKALVGDFNQEKALVGAFSVIVQPVVKPMDSFTALYVAPDPGTGACGQLTVVTATNTRPGQQAASAVWPGEWREDQERPVLT